MKYTLLAIFCACIACSPSLDDDNPSPLQKPNIIFVITDDQGYGDLGIHGNKHINTPVLDSLSRASVRFTNFHSATTCAPTRSSIMTGYNCNTVGVWHTVLGRSFLNASFPTLPEMLKKEGYSTGIFGKWHLGDNYPYRPEDRGFDEVLIHGGGGVGQTPDLWNNDYFDDTYIHNGEHERYEGYCTDVWFGESMKWIEKQADSEEPFFAYISTNAPHGPFNVHEDYIDPYADNPDIRNPNFYGMITNIDDNMGRLLKMMEESELSDNTILVFMTDNGSSQGASLDRMGHVVKGYNAGMRGMKGSEYEGGHRVPLFMRFPQAMNIQPGSHSELTSVIDLLPTFLDMLDVDTEVEGSSFLPLLKNGRQEELIERIVVVDKQRVDRPVKWKNTAVMKGKWRLVNQEELYNIDLDPGQKNNIISENLALADEMSREYDTWWASNEAAFQQNNYLPVGYSDEAVLLTCHDWVGPKDPPWHQGFIREAKVDNGYWNIDVKKAGKYKISLYRWPPSLAIGIEESVPAGDNIPGGEPWPVGKKLEIGGVKLELQDKVYEANVSDFQDHYEFEVELNEGPSQLLTRMEYKDAERGAYYVQVESLSL